MVSIVVVSHSAAIAEGVIELAREMGGPEVALEPAGGLDEPGRPLGTDAALVLAAIERAQAGDGVLVLMDLGSAVLSAETALDLMDDEARAGVLLCEAPLVEGAVAAAVAARAGLAIERVAAEARGGLSAKVEHLGGGTPETEPPDRTTAEPGVEERILVSSPHGLHARPAARLVRTASGFDARVEVSNPANGRGPASATSLNALATLGVRQGQEIVVRASGPEADDALAALRELAAGAFGEGSREQEIGTRAPEPPTTVATGDPTRVLVGVAASPGAAIERALSPAAPVLEVPDGPSADPALERETLELALSAARAEIAERRERARASAGEAEAEIFDAHLLMLSDDALLEPARRAIAEDGANGALAWDAAVAAAAESFRDTGDDYLAARATDVRDVGRVVLAHLLGRAGERAAIDRPCVLVARDLAPSDAADLDPSRVRAIVLAGGGATSHSAIIARSLGVPAVVGLGPAALAIEDGTPLGVDGDAGRVWIDPSDEVVADLRRRAQEREHGQREARAAAHEPALTRDGRRIEVVANVGQARDAAAAVAAGAEGIGLLRTELLFAGRDTAPHEGEIEAALREVAEALEGRPLIVRTLDAGADKPLPYLQQATEDNPFLGLRGIRLTLAEPELLSAQLRAIVRVAIDHPVRVMFPMVATVAELRRARELLDQARADVPGANEIEAGVMVEVPSLALMAQRFVPHADFFSIGTNDLAQYTMAAERGNPSVAALADALHPPVLALIARVVEAAREGGRWVGVCGELAGDPLAVPVLVGLGVTELSVAPTAVATVKQAVRSVSLSDAGQLARAALDLDSASAVRDLVRSAAAPAALTQA